MKKIFNIFCFVIFSMAVFSCTEKDELQGFKINMKFSGAVDTTKVETKTTLGGEVNDKDRKVLWLNDDRIAISNGTDAVEEFVYSGEDEAAVGVFEGSIVLSETYKALYPYSESITFAENKFNMVLPATQNYKPGTFDNGAYPMVAKSATDKLWFKPLCGVLELNLIGTEAVTKLTFSAKNASEKQMPVSGAASVNMTYESTPNLIMAEDAGTSVVMDCGEEGVQLSTNESTFFLVLPKAIYNSFTIKIETASGKIMTAKGTKPMQIVAGQGLRTMPLEFVDDVITRDPVYDYIDEYGVNHGKGVNISGTIWAPVNCGYLAAGETHKGYVYGKLYQWGRKYGQGYDSDDASAPNYSSGENIVQGPVSNEEGNKAENKDKFYKNSSEPCDWCNPQLSEWSSENDPCPEGWRVPTRGELEKLRANYSSWTTNNGQNGYWFSGDKSYSSAGDAKVFFPAAGYLIINGNADGRGSLGVYWSSSVNGTNAFLLSLRGGNDAYMGVNPRTYGYSVRCVEDLTTPVDPTNVPTVLTQEVSEITSAGAKVKANVIADGGASVTARGVCWSTSANPTVSDSKTSNGTGVGEFSSSITGLEPLTTYYVRAYATNSEGTAYGEENIFTAPKVFEEGDYLDEYGVNHGQGVEVAGIVWAPVNCGYHTSKYKYGKLYQWGRKYGQGWGDSGDDDRDATYPSGLNLVSGPVSNEEGNKVENKDKFYKCSDENINHYDWCSPQLSDWSSEYDPCPAGWRVPTKSELDKLQANYSSWTSYDGQNGYWFSGDKSYSSSGVNKVFFPAAGFRYCSGIAHNRGSSGDYLSSYVSGTSTYGLGFHDGHVSMSFYRRAYGYSVRCVEDL